MSQTSVEQVEAPSAKVEEPQNNSEQQDGSDTQDRNHHQGQLPKAVGHVPPSTNGESSSSPQKSRQSLAQIATVMTSLCACVFLAALEVTIVSTALPTIASHFASDSGYTWIGTSFVLAHTASTPSWGKISDIWGRKPILLIANVIFFGGSLICPLVDDLAAFIAGRAIQGLGAAGIQTMVNVCISDMFSQRDRGLYYGLTSIVWAVASGVGPVLGGAFTDRLRFVNLSG